MPLFENINTKAGSHPTKITTNLSLNLAYPPIISRINLESIDGQPLDTLHMECVLFKGEYQFRTFVFETPRASMRKKIIPFEKPGISQVYDRFLIGENESITVTETSLKIEGPDVSLNLSWSRGSPVDLSHHQIISSLV